jgi:hypothetical protein
MSSSSAFLSYPLQASLRIVLFLAEPGICRLMGSPNGSGFLLQIHVLFDKMDAKKAGIISRGDFARFIEGNPEYLLIFLIAKPDLLASSKLEFDKDFLNVDRQLTD